jgi:hypothetical protein
MSRLPHNALMTASTSSALPSPPLPHPACAFIIAAPCEVGDAAYQAGGVGAELIVVKAVDQGHSGARDLV